MKTFNVYVPFSAVYLFKILAENEEEAIQNVLDEGPDYHDIVNVDPDYSFILAKESENENC